MLAIEVTFLLERYSATDYRDRGRPEWPPHPDRLFSALTASAAKNPESATARETLRWLESLPPPHLHADPEPGGWAEEPVTVFVPVNDPSDDLLPARAEKQPRSFPSVVPAGPVVFIWPDAEPNEELRRRLASVAAGVTYLGSSRSPVLARLTVDPPAATWVPDPDGDVTLRVPAPGRLAELEWHFNENLRPPTGRTQAYRRLQPAAPGVTNGAFGELFVYRLTGPVVMELETTLKVGEALRAAVMSRAQEVLGQVPPLLSGHESNRRPLAQTHAAFLPLPFVSPSQPHADGHLLGVAVALPRSTPVAERRRIGPALAAVDYLSVPGVGRLGLTRIRPGDPLPLTLRPETWTGPSRVWSSVTPVVLDRFPEPGGRDVGAIAAGACQRAGLPAPEEVAAARESPLYGVPPSNRFPTQRSGRGPRRPFTHLTLRFPVPVTGPVLVGAMRYFGLGLFRPLPDNAS